MAGELKFYDTFVFDSPREAVEKVKKLIFEDGIEGGWVEFDEEVSDMVYEKWPHAVSWECSGVWATASAVLVEGLRVELP